jgi:hypothetical protein
LAPVIARVRLEEHRLRRGPRRLRRPRVEGHAQQRRAEVQAVQTRAADERRGGNVEKLFFSFFSFFPPFWERIFFVFFPTYEWAQ